jgi:hypothetical protein
MIRYIVIRCGGGYRFRNAAPSESKTIVPVYIPVLLELVIVPHATHHKPAIDLERSEPGKAAFNCFKRILEEKRSRDLYTPLGTRTPDASQCATQ